MHYFLLILASLPLRSLTSCLFIFTLHSSTFPPLVVDAMVRLVAPLRWYQVWNLKPSHHLPSPHRFPHWFLSSPSMLSAIRSSVVGIVIFVIRFILLQRSFNVVSCPGRCCCFEGIPLLRSGWASSIRDELSRSNPK